MPGIISRLLFPEICPFCEKNKKIETLGCCDSCYEEMVYPEEKAFVLSPEFAPYIGVAACASFYSGKMQKAMQKFKFSGANYFGKNFGKIVYNTLKNSGCIENTDVVTTVPVSDTRFKERGYNQSFLIAKEICKLTGLSYRELLLRNKQGEAQSNLLLKERQQAVSDRFSLKEEIKVEGLSILLIDDILTTGSTSNQCGKLLKEAGASWVTLACVTGGRKEFG